MDESSSTSTPRKSRLNLDPLSLKSSSSYTSLKDVLPFTAAAVNSPTSSSAGSHDISIRNRLVKQAAWAYLQPMSPSPISPSGPLFLRRLRSRFSSASHRRSRNPLAACFSFIRHRLVPFLSRTLHRMLLAIRRQVPIQPSASLL